jgi:hypothetical protein
MICTPRKCKMMSEGKIYLIDAVSLDALQVVNGEGSRVGGSDGGLGWSSGGVAGEEDQDFAASGRSI